MKTGYNDGAMAQLESLLEGKDILFISTKEPDYIRNAQELNILQQFGKVTILAFSAKSYAVRVVQIYLWLLFHSMRPFDVVYIGFAPQLVLPVFHRKFRHSFVIVDFFISIYDTLVFDRKKFRPGSLPACMVWKLDAKTIAKANHVVVDTVAHGQYFQEEFGLEADALTVLYLQADHSIYNKDVTPDGPGKAGRLTVLYFGSILPLQGVDVVLESIRLLQWQDNISFILVGPLDEGQRKKLLCCKNVEIHRWLSQKELAQKIMGSNLCLAGHFNAQIDKARRTIPGKAYIYEAMGKPLILGDCAANRELFEAGRETIFVPQGNAKALADAILHFYGQRKTEEEVTS